MMSSDLYAFPAVFIPDQQEGFIVRFRDLPEAITQGDTVQQCLSEAVDCLAEALAARIDDALDIPFPSEAQAGEYLIPAPLEIVWKAEIYTAMRQVGFSRLHLSNQLGVNSDQLRRLIDPRCGVDQGLAQKALALLCSRDSQIV